MKQTFLASRAWFRANFMFAVIVPEYKGIHWCWTVDECTEWCKKYPYETRIEVSIPQYNMRRI